MPDSHTGALKAKAGNCGAILVMDDEKQVRDLIAALLVFLGYQATVCSKGEDALVLYGKARDTGTPFQAVILDLMVPEGMGGKDTALQILAVDPEAKLIVSSGYSHDPVMTDHKRYGFQAQLAKPFRICDLAAALASTLSKGDRLLS